jgi:hypothetical protein
MIRETYKGRQLKAVKGKAYGKSRISVNGTECGEWFGTQADVIEWAKGTIDDVDSRPFEGRWAECWYVPGTYELNEHGHVVAPGGICSCEYCEKRRIQSCANITAGGVCVCSHCMKPYLSDGKKEETVDTQPREQTEAYVGCWTCNQPATHVFTRESSNTLHACDNCTRIDRTEAESRGWTVSPISVMPREQASAKVSAMAGNLSDDALCLAWMGTEGKPVTQELALVRGWIMDELNRRLGNDLFDEWLIATDNNGDGVNPLTYLALAGK